MKNRDRALHAYFDGELGRFARVRFEARLRRSPELRRELEGLRALQALARESEPSCGSPDVWDAVSSRLVSIDAQVRDERSERLSGAAEPATASEGIVRRLRQRTPKPASEARSEAKPSEGIVRRLRRRTPKPGSIWATGALGAGAFAAAAAAVVAALVLSSGSGDSLAPPGVQAAGVIRYLDTGERSVMLVEGREDVTIIWLMDPAGGEA